MSEPMMKKKNPKRLPGELFRGWLRERTNPAKPFRLTRNSMKRLTPIESVIGSEALIIEKILEHVKSVNDLLKCRLVNSHWAPLATTRLMQLNPQSTDFDYYYLRNCYLTEKRQQLSEKRQQLSELVECAKNSDRFPCKSFRFRAGDMRSKDAIEFLTTMGSSVKTLTLYGVRNGTLCDDMNLTDILSKTPELETLVFSGGSWFKSTPANRLMLPALKSIEFNCYFTCENIHLILRAAPALENVVNAWKLDDVMPIVTGNKIHAVKIWCPVKFQSPENLVKLATATHGELRLSELSVVIHDDTDPYGLHRSEISTERLWQSYQKLLNVNTIRKLFLHCSKYPDKASFPLHMDNLEELTLLPTSRPGTLRHFPVGINLNATFPQLNTLSLSDTVHSICCAGSEWGKCFPLSYAIADYTGTLPTVITLNLRQESASVPMLRKLKKICPNVRNVEVCLPRMSNKVKIIEELFGEWRNLEQLSIDVEFGSDDPKSLDSLFTGLSVESLRNLMFDPSLTEREKLRRAEDTRHVLWIGSIRGLTKLDIKYQHRWSSDDAKKILVPFTEASGLYAFKFMPNLTVNLFYRSRECEELNIALNSISPYATIKREQ